MTEKAKFIRKMMDYKLSESSDAMFVVLSLESYRNEFYFEPAGNWPESEFRKRCIERWVVEELIERIREFSEIDPLETAESLLFEFLGYMSKTEVNEKEEIFRIAAHVMEDLVDYIYSMKGDV